VQTLEPEPIEVSEPSDEVLLASFHSHYEKFPPEQIIRGAVNEPPKKAADLVARDRANFLRRARAELTRQRALRAQQERQQVEKRAAEEKALRQEARSALRAAVGSYHEWIAKRNELRDSLAEREITLADLLGNQSPEVDLEQLKKQTAEVADCRLLADALRARLDAWKAKELGFLQPLRQAVSAAQAEFSLLHQSERAARITKARGQLDLIVDLSQLHKLGGGWGSVRGEDLASMAGSVIELDHVAGYCGSYPWQHPVHDTQLLTKAAELERYYTELVPLVARA
jgi:hypothetical protein